jgi:hypothetical protein
MHRIDLSQTNEADCDKEVALQAAVINNHSHVGCGDNFTCRLKMPRPVAPKSQLIPDTNMVALKRTGEMLSPFAYSPMLALPCNMAFWLSCDGTRYLREKDMYDQLQELGATKVNL